MARPYTERLLGTSAIGRHAWTCPPGYRAVVRNVDAVSGDGTGSVQVVAGGVYVCLHTFQGAVEYHFETRAVIYGGQELEVLLGTISNQCLVTGYLFEDSTGAQGAPGERTWEPLQTPEQLPSRG